MTRQPSPYAVLCKRHGRVFLTEPEYDWQMGAVDAPWQCPICHEPAAWDDENFERSMNGLDFEEGGDESPG